MLKIQSNRALVESLENRTLLSYSIATITDTQYTVESFPQTFSAQTAWLADHSADPAYNFGFVAHQGDLLRRGYSDYQLGNADAAMKLLDGKLPYGVSMGNHDYDNQFDDLDHHISSANFTSVFGNARYQALANSGFGGSSLDQRNRYQFFDAGGRQMMFLSLEWEVPDAALAWGQAVINANPSVPVILSTHSYLRSGGRSTSILDTGVGNSGQNIFDEFVKLNPQVFMVLSGHSGTVYSQVSANNAGSAVYEITADFEGRTNGGSGWMQFIAIDEVLGTITLRNYSPVTDQWEEVTEPAAFSGINFNQRFTFAPTTPIPNDPLPNPSPMAVADLAATDEGRSVTINVLANDLDDGAPSPLKSILTSLPASGAVFANANGTFTYTPDPKFVGVDTFAYVASDGNTASAPVTVTVTVNDTAVTYNSPLNSPSLTASGEGATEFYTSGTKVWQFNVTGGTEVTFAVNAWRDWSSNEYKFQYSTNNSTYYDMTQIVPASSRSVTRTGFDADEPYQMWRLPTTTAGTLYVKMVSTESQALGWRATVDEMFVMNTGQVPPPAAPSLLTGSYSTKTRKATLKWRDNATNETGYKVWYSTDGGNNWNYWTLPANSRSYVTPALVKGSTYLFRVSAFNAGGDSLFSNTVTILAT